MKIKLIAAVLAAGVSLPVLAQQVTVYGVLDQAVRSTNSNTGASTTSVVSGSFATSRIGFRGLEDLGNGLKASFILEGRLDGNNGTVGAGDNFFSRESSVSLSSPVGTVTVGRTDTSASEGVDTFVGIGNFGNFAFVSGVEYAGDRENTMRYTSPTVSGAQFQIGRSHASSQGAETDSASLTWSKGAVGFAVGHDDAGVDGKYTAGGARIDLGFASVGVMMGQREIGTTKTDVTAVSAKVPFSAGLAAHGAYRTSEAAGVKTTTATVGVSKALSKRFTVLAVYQDTDRGTAAGNFVQAGIVHSF